MKVTKWSHDSDILYWLDGHIQMWVNPSWKAFSMFRLSPYEQYNRIFFRFGRIVLCFSWFDGGKAYKKTFPNMSAEAIELYLDDDVENDIY